MFNFFISEKEKKNYYQNKLQNGSYALWNVCFNVFLLRQIKV